MVLVVVAGLEEASRLYFGDGNVKVRQHHPPPTAAALYTMQQCLLVGALYVVHGFYTCCSGWLVRPCWTPSSPCTSSWRPDPPP